MSDADRGTVAIAFVHEALAEVRRRGLDANTLLREAELSPALLEAPHARVTAERYGLLWHAIARALDDEFFGMDSRPMRQGSFTLLCHAVLHAGSLEQALLRALRFLRLVLDDVEGELERDGELARIVLVDRRLSHASTVAPRPRRAFADGTFLLIVHGLACWLVGRRIPLLSAAFQCERPAFAGEWEVLFSPVLAFDQARTAITFSSRYLDMRPVQSEGAMKQFLRHAPANFLVKYRNSAGLTAQLRRRLKKIEPGAWPDFEALATDMHCSSSTLRRRLEDEGQTYRTIQDDLRLDLAVTLLSHSTHSIAQIAAALGFAEASAFHRAFRKWTGSRPGEYRQNLLGRAA